MRTRTQAVEEKLKAEESSRPLKEEMDAQQARDLAPKPMPEEGKGANLHPGFSNIVEKVFIRDVESEYDRLEQALMLGDKRTDYGSTVRALDEAETNARKAHKLWRTAIVEEKRWDTEHKILAAAMRSEAMRRLQHEKDAGQRSKAITDADVESMMATLYPQEFRCHRERENRVHGMVASLENLADLWLRRISTLQTILSKQR